MAQQQLLVSFLFNSDIRVSYVNAFLCPLNLNTQCENSSQLSYIKNSITSWHAASNRLWLLSTFKQYQII